MGRSRKPLWVMPTVGSNPTVSAIVIAPPVRVIRFCRGVPHYPSLSSDVQRSRRYTEQSLRPDPDDQ